jgi:hypothetical protein
MGHQGSVPHCLSRYRRRRKAMAVQAHLIAMTIMVSREQRCSTKSSFMTEPAVGMVYHRVRRQRRCHSDSRCCRSWRNAMAHQTSLIGTVSMVRGELRCSANSALMAKSTVRSVL